MKSSEHGGDIFNPESGIDNWVTNAHEELLTISWRYVKIKKLFVVDNISLSQFIFHFISNGLVSSHFLNIKSIVEINNLIAYWVLSLWRVLLL